ncbi:MAG: TMEM165/GDT1 family protein [Marinisporobacter sp.]|jgi:putative Ca2+/H+ antiporter (TMEM165/GDT1 family)|nr:TMEM165/GDT1 family protein [Marinisporobacter sp.]
MFQEMIQSLFLIFIAEMGDKTQILAMAFATRFKVYEVLLGVFIGSLFNHGIAVAVGSYLSNWIPIETIQMIAGFLFVGFALWTLKMDEDKDKENKGRNFGPMLTVALAFFIGELGDKTQLTAITLAVDANFPVFVLFGTVTGMVLTSALGIFVGSKIGEKVPEFAMKWIAAGIFMFFGIGKLYNTLPKEYMTPLHVSLFFVVIIVSTYLLLKPTLKLRKRGEISVFRETAITLYECTHKIKEGVHEICLGEAICKKCEGKGCIIGYTKDLMEYIGGGEKDISFINSQDFSKSLIKKDFDEEKVIESLSMTLIYLMDVDQKGISIHKVRETLEMILFKQTLDYDGNRNQYYENLRKINKPIGDKIIKRVKELTK